MKRILIAEDDATIRTMEERILEAAGYRVVGVPDADAAWASLQEEVPDLAILDIMMPGRSGLELSREMKADGRLASYLLSGLPTQPEPGKITLWLESGGQGASIDTSNLSDEMIELLVARAEGVSVAELAARFGISDAALKMRIMRVRKRLRKRLDDMRRGG